MLLEIGEKFGEVRREQRMKGQPCARRGMRELQAGGVQRLTREAACRLGQKRAPTSCFRTRDRPAADGRWNACALGSDACGRFPGCTGPATSRPPPVETWKRVTADLPRATTAILVRTTGCRPIGASTRPRTAGTPATTARYSRCTECAWSWRTRPSGFRGSSRPPAGRWCSCPADARYPRGARRSMPARDARVRSAMFRPDCRCRDAPPIRPACRSPAAARLRARPRAECPAARTRAQPDPARRRTSICSPPQTLLFGVAAAPSTVTRARRTQSCKRLREYCGQQPSQRLVQAQPRHRGRHPQFDRRAGAVRCRSGHGVSAIIRRVFLQNHYAK